MPIQTVLLTNPQHVEHRLADHGFSTSAMQDIALVWGTEMISGNPDLPRIHPAFNAWSRGTEAMRRHGRAAGYTAENNRGVEMCLNKDTGMAIVLCAGNHATGDHLRDPSTKHPRGTCSREVLLAQTTLPWFGDTRRDDGAKYVTWIILARLADGKVHAEFSWPATVGHNGHVGKWRERIILSPIDLDAPVGGRGILGRTEIDAGDEINVPVKSRS